MEPFGQSHGKARHLVNFRVGKDFRVGGSKKVTFDVDALNLFNTNVAWGSSTGGGSGTNYASGPTFGYVQRIVSPRNIRFGVGFDSRRLEPSRGSDEVPRRRVAPLFSDTGPNDSSAARGLIMSKKTRREFMQGTGLVAGGVLTQPLTPAAAPQSTPARGTGSSPAARFKRLLESSEPSLCPVVHDVISAKLSVEHGFPLVLAGGGAISQGQFGIGDYGMLTITEMIAFTAQLAEAVDVPIIADGDDCGGNPLNVARAIRRFERAGAACVLMEDLEGAKHLPGLGENVLPKAQFVDKIKAAVDARSDMAILARCDAPLPEAWDRIVAYAEAGADLIMVGAIPPEEGPKVVQVTRRPLLSTRGAALPALKKNGVTIAVYSGPLLNAAVSAMDRVLQEIKAAGVVSNAGGLGRDRMARLIGSDAAVAAAKRYNALRR